MRLYLIRHAEPDYPRDALTPRGHRQAAALARRVEKLAPGYLYSSPMGRARETARPIAERLGLPCSVEPWTAELEDWTIEAQRPEHEPWGEAPAWELAVDRVRGQSPGDSWHKEPPFADTGLETKLAELIRASDAFLRCHGLERQGDFFRRLDDAVAPPIVLVCHGGFALTWLAHLLVLPPPLVWTSFTLAPASLTSLVFEAVDTDQLAPRCVGLGDLSHLDDPA